MENIKLNSDEIDVLKVFWEKNNQDPEYWPTTVDVRYRTGLEIDAASYLFYGLQDKGLLKRVGSGEAFLTREGNKLCRKLFESNEKFGEPTFVQNIGNVSGGQVAGHVSGVNVTGTISGENVAVGNGASVNIDARVYFQELERLIKEDPFIPEDEKKGLLAKLQGLTSHPMFVSLASRVFEWMFKAGA